MRFETELGIVLAIVSAVGGAILCVEVMNYEAISKLVESNKRGVQMTTVTSSWTSGGILRTVTTTRRDGESAEDWARRHQEEVDALLLLFPKDP